MSERLPSTPPVLAGFSFVRPLGAGGFADVFLCEQNLPRRTVAVKVLLDELADEAAIRTFHSEADVMAQLSAHPSILTIYQAGISNDGRPYLVLEYCPSSFAKRYRQEQLPLSEVLSLGVKMASALESVHQTGMLHRDIKPANILVTAYGVPVLADFGITTAQVGAKSEDEDTPMSVPWSSPEVIDGHTSGSVASEVWALGATLYSLLAGHSPFEAPGAGQNATDRIKSRIRRAKYVPINRPDLPPRLESVLQKAMSKDPGQRYVAMLQFAKDLQQVQAEAGITPTPLEVAEPAWSPPVSTFSSDTGVSRGAPASFVEPVVIRPQGPAETTIRSSSTGFNGTAFSPRRRSRKRLWIGVTIGGLLLAVGVTLATVLGLTGGV